LIFEGHLAPGSRLPSERDLSETLGVSRSTLRDAMNRLEARGYVERRSKSGNYICTAIPDSLREPIEDVVQEKVVGLSDIIEIRKVLELWAVARAAQSPSERLLGALRDCLKRMKAASRFRTAEQFARYSEADLRFHQVIAQMTRNVIYVHLIHFFSNLISSSISLSRRLVPGDFARQNLAVHERIFRAIEERNPARAQEAMLEHFRFVEQHLPPLSSRRRAAKRA